MRKLCTKKPLKLIPTEVGKDQFKESGKKKVSLESENSFNPQ